MSEFLVSKVVASLPTPLEADTIYFVRVGDGFDMYVTNSLGLVVAYPANLGAGSSGMNTLSLLTEHTTTLPSAPSAGVKVFSRALAERRRPAYIGPSGVPTELQSLLSGSNPVWWMATGNGTGLSLNGSAFNGSGAAVNVADTNDFSMIRRMRFQPGTSSPTGIRASATLMSRNDGFDYTARFGLASLPTSGWYRFMVGLINSSNVLTTLGSGSASGFAFQMVNGLSGTPNGISVISCAQPANTLTRHTTISTTDFPVNTGSVNFYEVRFFAPPQASYIGWSVHRLTGGSGQTASGMIQTALPPGDTLLALTIGLQTEISSSGAAFDLSSMYLETNL